MKVLKEMLFGFDLENIVKVEKYLGQNYKEGVDFKKYVGIGDDVMNCVEVLDEKLLNDREFNNLVDSCEEYVE